MGKARPLNRGTVLPLSNELGPAIREMREEKDMSPEDLAWLAGVDEKAVEHWEAGLRIISNSSLPRVAHVLETTPSAIWARAECRQAAGEPGENTPR